MSTPILQTKLYIPRPTQPHIARPNLTRVLEASCQPGCHLILVSAPAGFGKTTLVADWVRQTLKEPQPRLKNRVAWVTLDNRDNDPGRFNLYLLASLQRLIPELERDIQERLLVSSIPALEPLFVNLINHLAEIPGPSLIVLDDYHLITNPDIHQSISFLVENLPLRTTLILISRADPPFPLARMRARGQMTELRAGDLRFRPDESVAFFRQVTNTNLTEEQFATLTSRTEGWVAGLQLAALTMQGKDNLDDFITAFSGSHRYILDYLMEEVFGQQSEQRQEFLLRTVILERMNGSLCEAVSGQTGGQDALEALEADNLFLVPLDEVRGWYRYHHLFADLLNSTLRQRCSAEEIRSLHRKAGQWFQGAGLLEDALEHALAAQDYEMAAGMIETHLLTLFSRSEVPVLLGWIEKIPTNVLQAHPWIDVYRANTLALSGRSEDADALLAEIEPRIPPTAPHRAELLGHIAAVRAYTANLHGDADRCIEMADLTARYLPGKFLTAHGMAAFARADAYLAVDNLEAADLAFQEMRKAGQKTGQPMLDVLALCNLARVKEIQGHLFQAEKLYAEAFQWLEDHQQLDDRSRCSYEFGLAELLREWNRLDDALDHARTGDEIRKRLGGYVVVGDLVLMRIFQARGEAEAALEAAFAAEKSMRPNQFHLTTQLDFQTARVVQWLAVGDVDAANRWAQNCQGNSDLEQMARARLRLAQGQAAAALAILTEQSRLAERGGRFGRLIEMLSLQSLALDALGQSETAGQILARAISLARPAGYVRVFLDCGQQLCDLMSHSLKEGWIAGALDMGYTQDLLQAFRDELGKMSLVESDLNLLTAREIEVLELLAEGLSNKEMADHLVVAPSTIKQHLKHIYGKLDVHSRTQAVVRGQELGLL